jgi:hypothetical protein
MSLFDGFNSGTAEDMGLTDAEREAGNAAGVLLGSGDFYDAEKFRNYRPNDPRPWWEKALETGLPRIVDSWAQDRTVKRLLTAQTAGFASAADGKTLAVGVRRGDQTLAGLQLSPGVLIVGALVLIVLLRK